ncbi:MAG: DUF3572 domain-containing protein [Pseudomonadota bacterium]
MRSSAQTGQADTIAIAALSYFATDPKTLARFFALTGLNAQTIRQAAATAGFTEGILDFVLADEELLRAVASAQEIPPEAIEAARRSLDPQPLDDDWPPRPAKDWA